MRSAQVPYYAAEKDCQHILRPMRSDATARWVEQLDQLEKQGWSEFSVEVDTDLVELAKSIGQPVRSRMDGPLLDRLTPKPETSAHPRSMSAVHGLGPFPFHTDAAYMRLPPRYMLMRLAAGAVSDRATLLCPFSELPLSRDDIRLLRNDVWLVDGGRGPFYSTILNETVSRGGSILRLDPCCMRPAAPSFAKSFEVLSRAIERVTPHSVAWTPGRALLIDNWRVLHARASAVDATAVSRRVLERVLIS